MGTPGQVQVQVGDLGCCDDHQRELPALAPVCIVRSACPEAASAYGLLPEGEVSWEEPVLGVVSVHSALQGLAGSCSQ